MTTGFNSLRLEQVAGALEPFQPLRHLRPPTGGWLRAVRDALGRTQRQEADRLGIAAPTLVKSEQAEAGERISLRQLRKLAAGLDCELVYALVPRRALADQVRERASELAREEVLGVGHSMQLEEQRPSDEWLQREIDQRRDQLLAGKWSHLWR